MTEKKRDELAIAYARDGYALLEAVHDPASPRWLREVPAVQVLRTVLLQNYTRDVGEDGTEVIRRREKSVREGGDGLPPGHIRIASPYDTDARWGVKRDEKWLGYKLHITETCDDRPPCDCGAEGCKRGCEAAASPNLITDVATTAATVTGNAMTAVIDDHLAAMELAPGRHYLDSGYLSAEILASELRRHGIALVGPLLAGTSPQARAGGYTAEAFTIDWEHQQVTCPQGAASIVWSPCRQRGTEAIVVRFAADTCQACPAKGLCTRSSRSGRQLSLRPREVHEAVAQARAAQTTDQWKARYNIRAGVEGTMRQATHVTGIRRARYLGLDKTRLEHNAAAAAVNLIRLDAWWTGRPLDRTRTSHLQRLDFTGAA
jgi:Transposase DDE domain